ncbi:DUF317 domain-containing protein [Streptomyces hainanensis]|uniref:DUF317 domain-containing protein n=2 Tax=Streptomyces hainanensis TaxID=402648 RepID=A0A4R4TE86_9ACTN|nr:DUF317 domain-containing protein [Streptomyces hainanensis]
MEHPQSPSDPTYDVIGRCLADADDCGVEHILALLDSAGWTSWSDSDANVHTFDPTRHLAVQFVPEEDRWLGAHHILWRLWARPSDSGALLWAAEFTDHTPYEFLVPLVTAITNDLDAALAPTTHQGLLEGGAEALQPLLDGGWRSDPTRMLAYQSSAANASITFELNSEAWLVEVRPHRVAPVLWGARLSTGLPLHLLRMFCEVLGAPVRASEGSVQTSIESRARHVPASGDEGRHHGGR